MTLLERRVALRRRLVDGVSRAIGYCRYSKFSKITVLFVYGGMETSTGLTLLKLIDRLGVSSTPFSRCDDVMPLASSSAFDSKRGDLLPFSSNKLN